MRLYPAAPNPFNPHTKIRFSIGSAAQVQLRIYDVRGALVRTLADRPFPAGLHELAWDGRTDRGGDAGSGAYFIHLAAGGRHENRKVILLR